METLYRIILYANLFTNCMFIFVPILYSFHFRLLFIFDDQEKEIKHGQETLNEDLDEMKSRLRDFNVGNLFCL